MNLKDLPLAMSTQKTLITSDTQYSIAIVHRALKDYYAKKANLDVPIFKPAPGYTPSFLIKDSYRDLVLLDASKAHHTDNADCLESSLAKEQSTIYNTTAPLALDQLFISITGPRDIKKILISGAAGIGKSTLCQHLAYQWSQGEMFMDNNVELFDAVFWLTLKELTLDKRQNYSIEDWIYESCFDSKTRHDHKITLEHIKAALHDNENRCLLILDGFDEVSALFEQKDDPRQKLLYELLAYRQVVVTTRPYGRMTLQCFKFDREVEDVGFSDASIHRFIHHYFQQIQAPEHAEKLWEYIQQQPVLKKIAAIPLQTGFLCFTWIDILRHRDQKSILRLTALYQLFIREIWVRGYSEPEKKNLPDFARIEVQERALVRTFAKIAYDAFTKDKEQPLINKAILLQHIADPTQLTRRGIIRDDDQGDYLFMHLTLQEFFAAYHLFLQLTGNEDQPRDSALSFIVQNKYHSPYESVITFLIGLVHRQNVMAGVKEGVWDALFTFDVDWIGIRHAQLIGRALEESGRLDNQSSINPDDLALLDQLVQWVQACINSKPYDFFMGLRDQLRLTLTACPTVTHLTFLFWFHTYNRCERFPPDFWLPLLDHLQEVALQWLVTLLTADHKDISTASMVHSIEWTTLKRTSLRKSLLHTLSTHIEQRWNAEGDEWINCLLERKPSNADRDEWAAAYLPEGYPLLEAQPTYHFAAAMRRMLPVWLSLLQEGDDQAQPLSLMIERFILQLAAHEEPGLQWVTCLAKAILDPRKKTSFLESLILSHTSQSLEHGHIALILPTLSGWQEPRELLADWWWCLLKEQDLSLYQRAVQRLDHLLDKSEKSNSRYQELQQIFWRRRAWPDVTISVAAKFYRKERFALLIKVLGSKDRNVVDYAVKTVLDCDSYQWNPTESAALLGLLLSQFDENDMKTCILTVECLASLAHHHCDEVIAELRKIMQHPESIVREAAVKGLGKILKHHSNKVIPILEEAANDRSYSVQEAAAKALGMLLKRNRDELITEFQEVMSKSSLTLQEQEAEAEALSMFLEPEAPDYSLSKHKMEVLQASARLFKARTDPLLYSLENMAPSIISREGVERGINEEVITLLLIMKDPNHYARVKAAKALAELLNCQHVITHNTLTTLFQELKEYPNAGYLDPIASVPTILLNLIRCPLTIFQTLVSEALSSKEVIYVTLMLPFLCNYNLKLYADAPPNPLIINPLLPLENLAISISQLTNPELRRPVLMQLEAYYTHYKTLFIEQLVDYMQQGFLNTSQVMLLCQMLAISSVAWFNALQLWFRKQKSPSDWHHALVCLAQLLYIEGASLCLTPQNDFRLCYQNHSTLIKPQSGPPFATLLLEKIQQELHARGLPYQETQTLLRRDLPRLLPHSPYTFFSQQHQTDIGYQPVYTYQEFQATKQSVDCQDLCQSVFDAVKLDPSRSDENIQFLQDLSLRTYKITLPKNRNPNDKFFSGVIRTLFYKNKATVQALDLSDNALIDRDIVLLCQYLKTQDSLRILKLSRNRITRDGFSTLLISLSDHPSVKYLLLDHNWIAFDPNYCATLLKRQNKLGLVNLDLSFNYISRGQLIEGKILNDEKSLQEKFGEAANYCERIIMNSLILRSSSGGEQQSFLRSQFSGKECHVLFDNIHTGKSCVGLMAYLDPHLGKYGMHSFLVIEIIHPGYGQRQFIVADLVVDELDQIQIRVSETTPTEFLAHLGDLDKIGGRIALTDADNINTLLKEVYKTRNIREFTEYKIMPREQGKVNCHRQAVRWLVDAKIIPKEHQDEWLHIEPEKKCVIL
jgi:HEAT repeat protein